MAHKQNKQCPHCHHDLVGTEVFFDDCPYCHHALHAPQTATHDKTQITREYTDPIRASRLVKAPTIYTTNTLNTGKTYKGPFIVSLLINIILLATLCILGLMAEEPITTPSPVSALDVTAPFQATNISAADVQTAATDNELPEQDEKESILPVVSVAEPVIRTKTAKNTQPVTSEESNIAVLATNPDTPDNSSNVTANEPFGQIMISSTPVSKVYVNGKQAGMTPGAKALLQKNSGIIIVGDNSTPYTARFIYREVDGNISYRVSTEPASIIHYNGSAYGRSPQNITSSGGTDNFNFDDPLTRKPMKVIIKITTGGK